MTFTCRNRAQAADLIIRGAGPISANGKLVLLCITCHLNAKGGSYPSQELLAAETCLGERTVRREIAALLRDGHLSVASRGNRRRAEANTYRVHPRLTETAQARKAANRAASEARKAGIREGIRGQPRHDHRPKTTRPQASLASQGSNEGSNEGSNLVAGATDGVSVRSSSRKILEHHEALYETKKGRPPPKTSRAKNATGAKKIAEAVSVDEALEAVVRHLNDPWALRHQPNLAYLAANLEKYLGADVDQSSFGRGRREPQEPADDADAPWRQELSS